MTTHALTFDQPFRILSPLSFEGAAEALALPPLAGSAARRETRAPTINDTLGWDTVFAVPVERVNGYFSGSGHYPIAFDQSVEGDIFDVDISGVFSAWEIRTGGSGSIVNLRIPIKEGEMKVGKKTWDLARATLAVQIKLDYIPQPSEGGKGTPQKLLVRNQPMNETGSIATVTQVTFATSVAPDVTMAAQTAFQEYFNSPEGIAKVTHVFNTVNINATAASGEFQWMKPTYTSYAYYEPAQNPTIASAVFGVLNMVSGKSPANNSNQIGPAAIPAEAQSGLSVSGPMFLTNMVLPIMAVALGGPENPIDSSYFKLHETGTRINQTKTIPLAPVRYLASTYKPECTRFDLTLQATELVLDMDIHTEISPGIDAYVRQTHYYKLVLKTEGGKQHLTYEEARDSVTSSWTVYATWIIVTAAIVAVVGAVVGGVVGYVVGALTGVIVAVVISLVAGVAAATPFLIGEITSAGVLGKLPPVDAFVTDATNATEWTGGQVFAITKVQLNGTLQLGGIAFPEG